MTSMDSDNLTGISVDDLVHATICTDSECLYKGFTPVNHFHIKGIVFSGAFIKGALFARQRIMDALFDDGDPMQGIDTIADIWGDDFEL